MVFVLVCAMCTADYFVSESDPFIPTHISLPLGQYSLGGKGNEVGADTVLERGSITLRAVCRLFCDPTTSLNKTPNTQ